MRRAALTVALLAGFSLIVGHPAMAGHVGATYEVTVEDSIGTIFTACMRFVVGSNELTIDQFPGPGGIPPAASNLLQYRHQNLDTDLNTFMAVTKGDADEFGKFMVFGRFFGSIKFDKFKGPKKNQRIEGQSVAEIGATTTFSGEAVLTCP